MKIGDLINELEDVREKHGSELAVVVMGEFGNMQGEFEVYNIVEFAEEGLVTITLDDNWPDEAPGVQLEDPANVYDETELDARNASCAGTPWEHEGVIDCVEATTGVFEAVEEAK